MGGTGLIRRLLRGWIAPALLALALPRTADARRAANSCADISERSVIQNYLQVSMTTLQHTVTNFDPSWFDMDNPERAPTLFFLTLNRPDSLAGRVRLKMLVSADTTLGRDPSAPKVVALDRMSLPLGSEVFNKPLRSNDVFEFTWEAGYGTGFQESDMFDVVAQKRQAPEMNLYFNFAVTCEDNQNLFTATVTVPVTDFGGSIGRLRYVRQIQALYPGTPITSYKSASIYTINPIFKVASELFNSREYEYPPGEPKIEIFIYELMDGENPQDAMDGLEFAKFGLTEETPSAYPAGLPRLEPGRTYVWRARAVLRGPTTDYLYSNALFFKVDPRLEGGSSKDMPASEVTDLRTFEQQIKFGDDYAKRVLAALKIILGENFEVFDLSRAGKLPAKGQIRLNGHPYTLEELERLAREFHQSKHNLTRLRFQ